MIKNTRNLLWLVPLGLFLTSPVWKPAVKSFLTPRGGYDASMEELSRKAQKNFVMDTVTITLATQGEDEWRITAERAQTGKDDREIKMDKVNALYIGDQREPTHITSDKGRYYIDDRHLTLIDSVVIRKPLSNQELNTELLHYYDGTKMAVSPGDVDIEGPRFKLKAGRMDYDLSTDGYDFSNRVTVDL